MFLLDTCAIAEMLNPDRDPGFQQWLASITHGDLATSTITVTETLYGVKRLPDGKRRAMLAEKVTAYFAGMPVIDYCRRSSEHAAEILAVLHAAGSNIKFQDAAIAGTALGNGATLVTRDKDFTVIAGQQKFSSFSVFNPWSV